MKANMFKGSRILLVEDEETLARGLEFNLQEEGYRVIRAGDGRQALELFQQHVFDLIVLDIMLPFQDGFQVAEAVRNRTPRMPILMLTARTGLQDRVKGLEIGADDYMTKPFHLEELLLRVQGMLKRSRWYHTPLEGGDTRRFGPNEVCFETLKCQTVRGEIHLTPREGMVLKYLIEHQNAIVSRQELLENVWNLNPQIETRTVDNFIMRLRKYFEEEPGQPRFFQSVRGAGYLFNIDDE